MDRSQLKIIMGYGSNRAGDGANVTVCVISSYQEKKKKTFFEVFEERDEMIC